MRALCEYETLVMAIKHHPLLKRCIDQKSLGSHMCYQIMSGTCKTTNKTTMKKVILIKGSVSIWAVMNLKHIYWSCRKVSRVGYEKVIRKLHFDDTTKLNFIRLTRLHIESITHCIKSAASAEPDPAPKTVLTFLRWWLWHRSSPGKQAAGRFLPQWWRLWCNQRWHWPKRTGNLVSQKKECYFKQPKASYEPCSGDIVTTKTHMKTPKHASAWLIYGGALNWTELCLEKATQHLKFIFLQGTTNQVKGWWIKKQHKLRKKDIQYFTMIQDEWLVWSSLMKI